MQEKYEAFQSEAARRLRADVLGTEVVNGYTTVQQAEEISSALALSPGDTLLDLGGGRGWPGSYVARRTGCSLVVCDLPMNALATARATLRAQGVDDGLLVRADGRRLPFPDASYHGICHTDVLC